MSDTKSDIYKYAIVKLAVRQVLQYATTRFAWVALGPVNWIAGLVLSKIFTIALENTILGINILMIDIKIDGDVSEFKKLLELAKNTPKDDIEKSDEIEKKLIESSKNLIKLLNDKRL